MVEPSRPSILDTRIWLELMEGDGRLADDVVAELERAAVEGRLFVSAVSLWEVASLVASGTVRLVVPVRTWLEDALATPGLTLLPIDPDCAAEAAHLPDVFPGDTVDRLLVAAARTSGGLLYTADPVLLSYARAGHVSARAS